MQKIKFKITFTGTSWVFTSPEVPIIGQIFGSITKSGNTEFSATYQVEENPPIVVDYKGLPYLTQLQLHLFLILDQQAQKWLKENQ